MINKEEIKSKILSHPIIEDVTVEIIDNKWVIECSLDKEKQKKTENRETSTWGRVWGDAYQRGENKGDKDASYDFSGYIDSFTDKEYTSEEIDSWFGSTVNSIEQVHPKGGSLLELGSGTGMVIHGVQSMCGRIVASDVSKYSIEKIESDIKEYKWDHIEVVEGDALTVLDKIDEKFDTIVLNTIVQYFPSLTYLNQVLIKAKALLKDPGNIYIGDIRDSKLLHNFHLALLLSKTQDTPNIKQAVENEVQKEREMLYSYQWFHQWAAKNGAQYALTEVRTGEKAPTEMKAYRYNASLNFSSNTSKSIKYDTYNTVGDFNDLESILKNNLPVLLIEKLPNIRLKELLQQEITYLESGQDDAAPFYFAPDEVLSAAMKYNYVGRLLWDEDGYFSCALLHKNADISWSNFLATISANSMPAKDKSYQQYPPFSRAKNIIEKLLVESLDKESFKITIK